MFLAISIGLAVLHAALKPLSDGLFDTSMWVAKMLTPSETAEGESTQLSLKVGQAALMDGWLSNVPFITSVIGFSCVVVAFFHNWLAAVVMFFLSVSLGELMTLFRGRSVSVYLAMIYHKMANRVADYKRANDIERATAAESCCRDLQGIMTLYRDSTLRPPSPKQLKNIPCGDLHAWLNCGSSASA